MKSIRDYVMVEDNVLPADYCQRLINDFSQLPAEKKISRNDETMVFEETQISEHMPTHLPSLSQAMLACNRRYCAKNSVWNQDSLSSSLSKQLTPFHVYEQPRIKRYHVGKGKFDWHVDCASGESSQRALVMFWYLNDVQRGGETVFDFGDGCPMKVKPKAGRVLVFPPYFMFPHKGCIPRSNPKYVISSYACLSN